MLTLHEKQVKETRKGKKAFSIKDIFKDKRTAALIITACVLVLALSAGLATGMIGGLGSNGQSKTGIALAQENEGDENAEALPQTTRETEDPFSPDETGDPFSGPMKLTGVVLCGRGHHLAIIEAGGSAYVVSRGDEIAETWTVISIQERTVDLESRDRDMTLQMADR